MSILPFVSDTFAADRWREVTEFAFQDITYHRGVSRGTVDGREPGQPLPWVRIAFDRPDVRNAFRPQTVDELLTALDHARQSADVAAVILTGNGPSPKDGGYSFCSGGDQRVRGKTGYNYTVQVPNEPEAGNAAIGNAGTESADPTAGAPSSTAIGSQIGSTGAATTTDFEALAAEKRARARGGRLHILEVQRMIRTMPKVVIAAVPGWAAGGGHSLEVVCDLVVASREHARFKQTDANVGSFDAGYGSGLLARQVGDRRAREIFFLARTYTAEQAEAWGAINEAVPHAQLEETAIEYARLVASKSPQAIRMLKFAFNMVDDGLLGQQVFAGEATRLAYMTEEAREGRDAFLERREPDWTDFPYYY